MSNPKTLIKNSDRTREELSAMGKKGGAASVKKRRELKKMREVVRALLVAPAISGAWGADEYPANGLRDFGFSDDEIDQRLVLGYRILEKAKQGDMRAAEIILRLADEYPEPEPSKNLPAGEF